MQVPAYDAHAHLRRHLGARAAGRRRAGGAVAGPSDQIYGANVDGEVSVKVSAFPIDSPDLRDRRRSCQTAQVEQIMRAVARPPVRQVADPTWRSATSSRRLRGGSGDFDRRSVRRAGREDRAGERLQHRQERSDRRRQRRPRGRRHSGHRQGRASASSSKTTVSPTTTIDQIVDALAQLDRRQPPARRARRCASPSPPTPLEGEVARPHARQHLQRRRPPGDRRARRQQHLRARRRADLAARAISPMPSREVPAGGAPTLYDAVYETALEQQVPKPLIDQLIRIFAFDVDFQQRISAGRFAWRSSTPWPTPADQDAGDPEVLFASLTPRRDGEALLPLPHPRRRHRRLL